MVRGKCDRYKKMCKASAKAYNCLTASNGGWGSARTRQAIVSAGSFPSGYSLSKQNYAVGSLRDMYSNAQVRAPMRASNASYGINMVIIPQVTGGKMGTSYATRSITQQDSHYFINQLQTVEHTPPSAAAPAMTTQSITAPAVTGPGIAAQTSTVTASYGSSIDYSTMSQERAQVREDAVGLGERINQELKAMQLEVRS